MPAWRGVIADADIAALAAFVVERNSQQGRVDRAEVDVAAGPLLDLVADGDAVRLCAQPQQGQQNELLELTQAVVHVHFSDYVGEIDNVRRRMV